MKILQKSKYLLLGAILGIGAIGFTSYAAVTGAGTIGSLFEKIGSEYKLVGLNIKDISIGNIKLIDDTIESGKIKNETIRSEDIQNGTIANIDLADNSIKSNNIVNETIRSEDIQNGTITNIDLADDTIESIKIKNETIRSEDIQNGTIQLNNLDTTLQGKMDTFISMGGQKTYNIYIRGRGIDQCRLRGYSTCVSSSRGSCTYYFRTKIHTTLTCASPKIWGIAGLNIKNNTVTSIDIANNTVTSIDIANNTITSTDIQNNTVTSIDIANNTITSTDIQNYSIAEVDLNYGLRLKLNNSSSVVSCNSSNTWKKAWGRYCSPIQRYTFTRKWRGRAQDACSRAGYSCIRSSRGSCGTKFKSKKWTTYYCQRGGVWTNYTR